MKIMNCPLNGPRNISEFVFGGEVTDMPMAISAPDVEWADYVFLENNSAGVVREWWLHTTSGYWFIAERNTTTDEIICTYPASQIFAERLELEQLPEENNNEGGAR